MFSSYRLRFFLNIFSRFFICIRLYSDPEGFNLTLDPGNNEYTIMNHQICNP